MGLGRGKVRGNGMETWAEYFIGLRGMDAPVYGKQQTI